MNLMRLIAIFLVVVNIAMSADDSNSALTKDLEKLAEESPSAKAFLAKPHKTGILKYYGELGYYAAEASNWSYERMQLEYPALCIEGQLVAILHAENGRHYVIYTVDGLGPFAGSVSQNDGYARLERGESVTLKDLAGSYNYSVIHDIRGDVLVASFSPRHLMGATVQTVYISHLYIHNDRIEALKHVTEEYPIRKKQPDGRK